MHRARPRPAAGVWLQVAQRILVDFDERDVLACGFGLRGAPDAPVVGAQLDEVERAGRAVRGRGERRVAGQDDGRANRDRPERLPSRADCIISPGKRYSPLKKLAALVLSLCCRWRDRRRSRARLHQPAPGRRTSSSCFRRRWRFRPLAGDAAAFQRLRGRPEDESDGARRSATRSGRRISCRRSTAITDRFTSWSA